MVNGFISENEEGPDKMRDKKGRISSCRCHITSILPVSRGRNTGVTQRTLREHKGHKELAVIVISLCSSCYPLCTSCSQNKQVATTRHIINATIWNALIQNCWFPAALWCRPSCSSV